MMAKCIIFENLDGSLSVRGGQGPRMLARFEGDVDAALRYILTELVPVQNPDAINPRIVDYVFPADREFRGAWEDTGVKVDINMPKAQLIQESRINAAKRVEARNLVEREVLGENVTSGKARLKGHATAPATTPAELRASWPAWLPRN